MLRARAVQSRERDLENLEVGSLMCSDSATVVRVGRLTGLMQQKRVVLKKSRVSGSATR